MKIIESFIQEYKHKFLKPKISSNLQILVKDSIEILCNPSMLPSIELINAINKLKRRTVEPMKVAISGQFSSGKSTFLNAILSKNILPTGITPVTSKVNFIRYSDELKIKVRYKDGREAYFGIESIKKFTDQRMDVEDIKYLTLYAPVDILKEVVFVDTPGLNSQASSDTKTTEDVLKEVDGIIWLTLIDNAGRQSEIEVLEKHMDQYQNKSICVLNQKDKLSQEEIEKTLNYVSQSLGKFFDKIVAISAIQALKARSSDKKAIAQNYFDQMQISLKDKFKDIYNLPENEELCQTLTDCKDKIYSISKSNMKENLDLLAQSNIQKVLDYIYENISPKANEAKEFAIKKELKNICSILVVQYQDIIKIYEELEIILNNFEEKSHKTFEEVKHHFTEELKEAYSKIIQIIDQISSEIFLSIKSKTKTRYIKQKSNFLGKKNSFMAYEYEVSCINSDDVYKKLFYDDDLIGKMFKKYVRNLKEIQDQLNDKNHLIYEDLEISLKEWQKKYEKIRKNNPLYSDIEFGDIRRFASKAYENFLKPFNDCIKESYAKISSQFNHLSSAVSFNYQNATQASISFLEYKISQSIELYEENPTLFGLYQPKIEEIKERLVKNFYLYELENMMSSNKNFVSKNYDWLMDNFTKIKEERLIILNDVKNYHKEKIEKIKELDQGINLHN